VEDCGLVFVTFVRHPIFIGALILGVSGSAVGIPDPPDSSGIPQASAAPTPVTPKKPKKPRYVFTFEGRGFGHGVGMSQYGAYGAAKAGKTAEQIIALYYSGTSLQTLPVTPVRVLLSAGSGSVTLRANGAWNVLVEGAPALVAPTPLPPNTDLTVARAGAATVVANPEGVEVYRATGPVRFTPVAATTITSMRGVRYRGLMRVVPEGSGVTVINHVDLEQYLPGVVPREMPAGWGDSAPAALEAQAIAARSYAMATKKTGRAFDMYADERSQVYGGASAEDPRTSAAVTATAGKVVTSGGAIVTTFFFSTSGGKTENVENVFSNRPLSYLVSVDDEAFDAASPHHVWKDPKTFTDAGLARMIGLKSPVLKIKILQRGASPRVKLVRFTSRNGTFKDLRGTEVRSLLGLRDSWFFPRRKVRTPATLRLVTTSRANQVSDDVLPPLS
jgi:stage II sporulation protein D